MNAEHVTLRCPGGAAGECGQQVLATPHRTTPGVLVLSAHQGCHRRYVSWAEGWKQLAEAADSTAPAEHMTAAQRQRLIAAAQRGLRANREALGAHKFVYPSCCGLSPKAEVHRVHNDAAPDPANAAPIGSFDPTERGV